ncbi:MAG: sugar phosphate isomerase/epimerase family protein [Pseudomonadota bacterium]
MPQTLPLSIGAAMSVERLPEFREWLIEGERDLELQSFHTAKSLMGDWGPAVEEAKRQLDGYRGRLGVHGPFKGFVIHSQDPEIREVVTRRFMQCLDICEALGAIQMVLHSPFTPWSYNNMPKAEGTMERVIERTRKCLGPVIARAEDMGLTIVMENVADKDPGERNAVIDGIGSPAFKVSLDTGHAHMSHGTQNAPPVDYFVRAAGNRLSHVHLQDGDPYADRHWAIGEGSVPWHAVFREIAALESRPHLVLEMRNKADIWSSMRYLEAAGLAC